MATPKLRFKEFDGDWSIKSLSELANLTSSKRVHLADYVPDGIPFFRGKEITELKSGVFPSDILYISHNQFNEFKEKYGVPKNNEILITAVGTLANTYLVNTNYDFYFKDGNLIWLKDIKADPKFMMILLDAKKNDVLASAIGSTQKALTIANLNKLIFNFPSKEEQTKIASFLSNVDEKISQLTQKHALLSQYKQGMMQKLFSQQIRFKADDGREFGEFKQKCIKDLNLYISDGNYGELYPTASQFETVGIPFIRANNIKNLRITNDDMRFINEDLNRVLVSGHLKENDILVTTRGDVGMLALVDKQHENSNINAQICLLRVLNSKELDSLYLLYFLHSSFGQKQFKELQTGTALKQLPKKNLNQIIVLIPCLEEQTKIANFLSAIDQKIEVVAQQIEQAKQWKKGLLQHMFV